MDRTTHSLPLDGFRPELTTPGSLSIARVIGDVDGDDWGECALDDVQAKLVELDDFAIIALQATLRTADPLPDCKVVVNEVGLRNLNLDGTYLTPVKEWPEEGFVAYQAPDPLPAGDHSLVWSYAWNPPGDDAPDGVVLAQPRLVGPFSVVEAAAKALPESVDLRQLEATGLTGADLRVSFSREVDIPFGLPKLRLEGPADGTVEVLVNGEPLQPGASVHHLYELPFGIEGSATLELRFTDAAAPVTSLRLMR